MIYKSNYGKEELIARWDDITSPARFAGADEQNDWVFISSRKGDRIRLVRKPLHAYDPLASVFVGRIYGDGGGSYIKGSYFKGVADHILAALIFTVYYVICFQYYDRSSDKTSALILMAAGVLLLVLMFTTMPHTRKRYGGLIRRVTGEAPDAPADTGEKRPEPAENENAEETKEEAPKDKKFKFRF